MKLKILLSLSFLLGTLALVRGAALEGKEGDSSVLQVNDDEESGKAVLRQLFHTGSSVLNKVERNEVKAELQHSLVKRMVPSGHAASLHHKKWAYHNPTTGLEKGLRKGERYGFAATVQKKSHVSHNHGRPYPDRSWVRLRYRFQRTTTKRPMIRGQENRYIDGEPIYFNKIIEVGERQLPETKRSVHSSGSGTGVFALHDNRDNSLHEANAKEVRTRHDEKETVQHESTTVFSQDEALALAVLSQPIPRHRHKRSFWDFWPFKSNKNVGVSTTTPQSATLSVSDRKFLVNVLSSQEILRPRVT